MKSVYALVANTEPRIIFYVGCTNNISVRLAQHRNASTNENHPEYNTDKYRFIRELNSLDISWEMDVLTDSIKVDEKSDEYSWILQIARYNIDNNIEFYDNPLTNMKAGDFLSEMVKDRTLSATPKAVKQWITKKKQKKKANYERETYAPSRNADLFAKMDVGVKKERKERQEKLDKKIKRLENQLEDVKRHHPPKPATIKEIEQELMKLRNFGNLFEEK